jgi:hypothetical protein
MCPLTMPTNQTTRRMERLSFLTGKKAFFSQQIVSILITVVYIGALPDKCGGRQ